MRSSLYFVGATLVIVCAGGLAAWLLGGGSTRAAVFAAGALALGTQLPAHLLLTRWRHRDDRFLAAVAAGFAARLLALALGVLLLVVPGRVEPLPFIASLGGFLVATLLAEGVFEHRRLRAAAAPARL